MKKISEVFSAAQTNALASIGLHFHDEMSEDELIDAHEIITDHYLTVCFDSNGDPLAGTSFWESIIDTMYDELDI